ncbi:hypothetical protein JCM10212_005209 [Sporobolomyces blumeae]
MAHIEDDFAAYTTIGDRVDPASSVPTVKSSSAPQGPKFGVPAKLEPFTLLAKSARGAGAANLVQQAISAPGVYVFSELLHLPGIKELATNQQHAQHYRLLELFAYGTWADYTAKRDAFPALKPEQETKLKQLTILSLASEARNLTYSTLLTSLDVDSVPVLEDLLIESIYANIISGRLDQKNGRFEIMSCLGRDVRASSSKSAQGEHEEMQLDSADPSTTASTRATTPASEHGANAPSVSSLLASLKAWQARIDGLLQSLDQHVGKLVADSVNVQKKSLEHEAKVKEMVFEIRDKSQGGGRRGGGGTVPVGGGGGEMDVDAPIEGTGRSLRGAASHGPGGTGGAGAAGGSPAGHRARKRGRM